MKKTVAGVAATVSEIRRRLTSGLTVEWLDSGVA